MAVRYVGARDMRVSQRGIRFIADFEGSDVELLADGIRQAEDAINPLGVELNQHQFDAAASFVHSCGAGTLDGSFGWALQHDLEAVPQAMSLYIQDAAGHVRAGLVRRRAAEGALFREPVNEPRRVPGAPRRRAVSTRAGWRPSLLAWPSVSAS
jgi:GH24 family phage-related lysozyme (muramidase)